MSNCNSTDPKTEALKASRTWNPHSEEVRASAFQEQGFFDPRDLVQVKYEMLRRVGHEGSSVSQAAEAFGFSRFSFYQARDAFQRQGLAGLLPKRRGPRRAHKLSDEVVDFLLEAIRQNDALRPPALAALVAERFGVSVHPRSIERALARRKKKRRSRR